MSVFARRLKEARKAAGLSQERLGILAEIDPMSASARMNQYEKGKHEPKLETAKRLAKVLGIPAAFLYAEDEQLAKLLLLWSEMSAAERRKLVKRLEDDQGSH